MDINSALEQVGLSQKETEVYTVLLQLGTQPASSVAKKIDVPRSTAHFLLESLVDKRFATYFKKGNAFYFTAEFPRNIVKLLESEREKEIKHKEMQIDLLKKLVPEMEGMMSKYTDIPQITFYEGMEAIFDMFHKKAAVQQVDSYIFSASNYVAEKYPEEVKKYVNEHNIIRKKNKDYVLDSSKYKKSNQKRNPPHTKFRYFPDKKFVLKTHIQIDGDHIAILNIENNPVGISIQHEALADDFRGLHQQLWRALGGKD